MVSAVRHGYVLGCVGWLPCATAGKKLPVDHGSVCNVKYS